MKDPRPLIEYIYEWRVKGYIRPAHSAHELLPEDLYMFQSIYTESTIMLSGSPSHNKYLNYYYHRVVDGNKRDKTQVYVPSKINMFNYIQEDLPWRVDKRQLEAEITPCIMSIYDSSRALRTYCSISQFQPVTKLYMRRCFFQEDLHASETLVIDRNCQSVSLYHCVVPESFLGNILHQLFRCIHSLEYLNLDAMNLGPFESLLDELLEDLVAYHEAQKGHRKLELRLRGHYLVESTNLSKQFVMKWNQRCKGIPSIDCDIY